MKKILIIALLFHLAAAWFSIGRYHADEQFQILEFAACKSGENTAASLPWEFHEKLRPGIQPGMAYVCIQAAHAIGIQNPFTIAFILRLLVSLFGLYATYRLANYLRQQINEIHFSALLFLSLCWCFVPWFHARFSSENLSASLFMLGSVFYLENQHEKKTVFKFLLAGFFFGLCGVIRFQAYFLAAGFFLWAFFINKEKIAALTLMLCGLLMAFASGLLCDKWLYGSWEFTSWNYVYQNFFLHKAENFGKEPLWFYFEKTLSDALPPFSIVLIAAVIFHLFKLWKSWISWSVIPFLLIHFISPHKELRFLFVLIPVVPFMVMAVYKEISAKEHYQQLNRFLSGKFSGFLRKTFIVVNFMMLFYLSFKPADDYTPALSFLYNNYHNTATLMLCESHAVNPYSNEISLNFYRSKSILVSENRTHLDSLLNVHPDKKFLFVSAQRNLTAEQGKPLKLVWSTLPAWMYALNVNGWADRVNQVCVYEVQR